jgi:diguanylate cyclase (GGDEF)-like protein/PAS domain S-box-containing protein
MGMVMARQTVPISNPGAVEAPSLTGTSAVRLAVGLGAAASVLGITTVAAWLLGWAVVLSTGPGSWPIRFNTSLGLALSGAALAGMALGWRRFPLVAAGYDLVVGSLALAEQVTGRDLGVDQLFIRAYVPVPAGLPGRVSPNASLCLVLLGAGIVASTPWRSRRRPRWLALSGAVVAATGVVAVSGYAAGLPGAHDWSRLSGMSFAAACGMTLLGVAAIALSWVEVGETVEWVQWWAMPAILLALLLDAFVWEVLVSDSIQASTPALHWARATTFIGILLAFVLAAAIWLGHRARAAARAVWESEQQSAASEERFRLAFEESLIGMALVSADPGSHFGYLRVNRAFCEFLGRSPQDLLTLGQVDVLSREDAADTQAAFEDLLSGELAGHRAERRFLDATGNTVWGLLSATLVHGADGTPLYMLCQVEDITARKRAEEQLAHRALHDDLTGLPNRALLLEHLANALARSRRSGWHVGVLFLDLDDFKSINDTYGHSAGDEFLTRVADQIRAAVRDSDMTARAGGDEFVIVCENLSEPTDAAVVADQIQRALTRQITIRGQSVTAGASIGVALSHTGSTAQTLLRDADAAMYAAKNRGGRCWQPADACLQAAAMRVLTEETGLGVIRNEIQR